MPSTEGSPPCAADPLSGEFGTSSGVQMFVKVSSISPLGHAATDGAGADGTAKEAATAGAAVIASAKPPARMRRRTENSGVAM